VLNKFLEVPGTFITSSNSTVHSPPTVLLHLRLHSIEHTAHFNVVEQLLSEYYFQGDTDLQVSDVPFNIGNAQALAEWNIEAGNLVAKLSGYTHVIVFITTHADPERGDLWVGHDNSGPCAATVGDVSTCLFYYCTDIDRELNSGSIKS
jgi:hypothetical protein